MVIIRTPLFFALILSTSSSRLGKSLSQLFFNASSFLRNIRSFRSLNRGGNGSGL